MPSTWEKAFSKLHAAKILSNHQTSLYIFHTCSSEHPSWINMFSTLYFLCQYFINCNVIASLGVSLSSSLSSPSSLCSILESIYILYLYIYSYNRILHSSKSRKYGLNHNSQPPTRISIWNMDYTHTKTIKKCVKPDNDEEFTCNSGY